MGPDNADAVPEMTPVVELIPSPEGSAGERVTLPELPQYDGRSTTPVGP